MRPLAAAPQSSSFPEAPTEDLHSGPAGIDPEAPPASTFPLR